MKSLKTLIRLANQNLDLLRKQINDLLDQKEMMEQQKRDIQAQARREEEYIKIHVAAKAAYDNFMIGVNMKLGNINLCVEQYDNMIEPLQEQISEIFSDLKKYEILLERKQQQQADEIARKDQATMDEIGLTNYMNKAAEETHNN